MAQQIEVTLPDSCSASEAQLAIDRHTVAQLDSAASGKKKVDVHCWQEGPDENAMTTICMLPAGHLGPHEWTRVDEIYITFHADHGLT